MGKGEENTSLSTPCSSNLQTTDIPKITPNFSNYLHGYLGPGPTWSSTYSTYPNAYQCPNNIQNTGYPFQYGMRPLTPIMAASSGTTERFEEDTPGCRETEAPCFSSMVHEVGEEDRPDSGKNDDGTAETSQLDRMDGGDTIEEPKASFKL